MNDDGDNDDDDVVIVVIAPVRIVGVADVATDEIVAVGGNNDSSSPLSSSLYTNY